MQHVLYGRPYKGLSLQRFDCRFPKEPSVENWLPGDHNHSSAQWTRACTEMRDRNTVSQGKFLSAQEDPFSL